MKIKSREFFYVFITLMAICITVVIFESKNKSQDHVIMISLDSVYEGDFKRLTSMPVIQELMEKGAYSNQVKTVYPTMTYAVHTSIITGTYPDKHGIYHNQPLQPGVVAESRKWFWYKDDIKVPSLFDLFQEEQLTTANIIWPVTGNGNMTYNFPQISLIGGKKRVWELLKSGTPFYIIESFLTYRKILGNGEQPKLDQFTTEIAVDTIKKKKPNLLTLHLIGVDSFRHDFGVNSKEIDKVFNLHEKAIEKIVQATKDAGIYEKTTFVITTDHGQIDVHHNVYLNNILKREGYITETKDGIDYEAYVQPIGLGAFIHIKEHNPIIKEEVRSLLTSLMEDSRYGIEHIYTEEELVKLHASYHYDLAIEASLGYQFRECFNETDFQETVGANHGYSPLKEGYQNVFIICGPKIKDNYVIGEMNIVDIAPTIAEIIGLEFYSCDGKSLAPQIKEDT